MSLIILITAIVWLLAIIRMFLQLDLMNSNIEIKKKTGHSFSKVKVTKRDFIYAFIPYLTLIRWLVKTWRSLE